MNNLAKNNYFNDYFNLFDTPFLKESSFMKTDIYEKGEEYNLKIDLPGLEKENINISYENGYLTITANKKSEIEEINNYIRRERFIGEVKRSFYIGSKKESDIKATYQNGILTITFPKEEEPKKSTKNITIK